MQYVTLSNKVNDKKIGTNLRYPKKYSCSSVHILRGANVNKSPHNFSGVSLHHLVHWKQIHQWSHWHEDNI